MGFLNSATNALLSLLTGKQKMPTARPVMKKVEPKTAQKIIQADMETIAKDFPIPAPSPRRWESILQIKAPVMVPSGIPFTSYRARIVSFSRTRKTVLLRRNRRGMRKFIRRPIESLNPTW